MKSSVSRTVSAVVTLGAPSLKSSVPIRVSTRSGVTRDGGIAEAPCAAATPGSVGTAHATRIVKSLMSGGVIVLSPCLDRSFRRSLPSFREQQLDLDPELPLGRVVRPH